MAYAINVDIDNLNYPDRVPTGCAYHPESRPHYDITIHEDRHARTTQQEFRYWITGIPTLTEATQRAEREAAGWLARMDIPILIRMHSCVIQSMAPDVTASLARVNRRHGPALKKLAD